MNYYAQGGQAHGLKSLAQELPKYGRNGDTIVAHINPEEAGILKALGGSGTINPVTGLPEFGFFKSVTNAVKGIVQPVYNATLKQIPGVDKALVGLDKTIGNTIPGGWNTLAQTALAFTPLGMPLKVGLAALGGSGAFGPNGKFNLQRALMSGAMAYGANQLTAGLQAAGGAGADATAAQVASNLGVEGASALPGSQAAMLAEQAAGFGQAGLGNIASSAGYNALPAAGANAFAFNAAGEMVPASIAPEITGATANIAPSAAPSATNSFLSQTAENVAAAGRGIQNLSGFGSGAGTAATNFTGPVTSSGMTALAMGTMGTMQLDEQQKALDSQLASGSIAQSEYDAQSARIADAKARAEQAVRENPYQFAAGGSVPGYFGGGTLGAIGANPQFIRALEQQSAPSNRNELVSAGIRQNAIDSADNQQLQQYVNAMRKSDAEKSAFRALINNPYEFARGGSIDDESGMDEARGLYQGNMTNGFMNGGSTPSYAMGGNVSTSPRFLSGGGDGMSDSIPATINGKQEARLADGEFVVPADVVSHIGNGSSKAGAKRLYSMMDKVRTARTGTKKQGKQINPNKFMPA